MNVTNVFVYVSVLEALIIIYLFLKLRSKNMSEKKLYIGNLTYSITDEELADALGEFGHVVEAKVIKDRETGRSRGFGFATVAAEDADKFLALTEEQHKLAGRVLVVKEAVDKKRDGGGGSGGGGGGRRPYPSRGRAPRPQGDQGYNR